MTRSILVLSTAILLLSVSTQRSDAVDLVPQHVASQVGLTEAWRRYLPVPAGADSIADQQIFVHAAKTREYVEITVPLPNQNQGEGTQPDAGADASAEPATRVLVRIPTDRVGRDGQPIGKQEAERLATNEIRRLKRRGLDAKLAYQSVPRIHLYTLADDGTIECRDAETGQPIWMTRVGDRELAYGRMGISDDHISVINGPNLIQLDVTNGDVLEEVEMISTPLHGAIHAGRYSLVPTIRSGVEGYPMYDPTLDPFMEVVAGIALEMPTKAPNSTKVAWGTDRGFVYVLEMSGEPSVLFRLDTDGIVSGRIASAAGNRFFFGSEAGQVYALEATRNGKVLWNRPFGDPFYNGPVVIGDQVLLRSTYGNLYALDVLNGDTIWARPVPNIDEIFGFIGDQVFARTLSGSMIVLDLKTGEQLHRFPSVRPRHLLLNTKTDRVYLVAESGAVQCLRPVNAELPTLAEEPELPPAESKPETDPANEATTTPFDPGAGVDPFGGDAGNDPFGGDAGNDPFGGGADPFGGGEDNMEDPFGGADPFGGN